MNKTTKKTLLGRRVARLTAICLLASCLGNSAVFAQSSSDDAWYWQLVKSVGKTLYFLAWPTDTYDHMEFGHIERQPGGADVYMVLYGNSWLEGNLWTEVVTEIRNGSVSNMRFGRYSSKALIAPGSTITVWGQALDEVNKEMKRQQAPQTIASAPAVQPPAAPTTALSVVCISNPTSNPITYSLPAEEAANETVAPGKIWRYWHYGPSLFTISFSATKAGESIRAVRLKGAYLSAKPPSCDDSMIYEFSTDGDQIGIAPRTWVPGSESSFYPNLYRADVEGRWMCGSGYKWASSAANDTTCVPADVGLIGITIKADPAGLYPEITAVSPDGAAGAAGILAGSRLIQVNGLSMLGLKAEEVATQIRGSVNTLVRIGVQAPGTDSAAYFELRRR